MNAFVFDVAKRFRQPSQQDGYIRFVSKASTTGIGLGCAVLILLLSVMNGFEYELRNSLLKVVPHAEIFAINSDGLYPEPEFIENLEKDTLVDKVFLLNKAPGLLQAGKNMKAVSLVGVDKEYLLNKFGNRQQGIDQDSATSSQSDALHNQLYSQLSASKNGILLGRTIIKEQNIKIGQQIQLLLPSNTEDLSFQAPKSAWVTVVGELKVGGELDNLLGLLNKAFLADLLGFTDEVTHIEIKMHDPFDAFTVVRKHGNQFSQLAYMSDWTRTNGHLYQDIQLIRTVVYIVLTLVIAVACFNIVSALVMSVKEKSKEIAILKTIGASNRHIASIFLLKGLYHGLKGALVGTVIGVLLAFFLQDIIAIIEWVAGTQIISSDIYFTGTIPSKLSWVDVITTSGLAIVISVLATIYPAKQAANVKPAENLH